MTEKEPVQDPIIANDVSALSETPKVSRKEIWQDPSYTTLYRYENKTVPYDDLREGVVSKKDLIGAWFTDSLDGLSTYFIARVQGVRGGNFIAVRVKKEDLVRFDATTHPKTRDMDIEAGNYVIPAKVIAETGLLVVAPFKEEWEGKKNLPIKDWNYVQDFIQTNLSDEALRSMA